MTQEQKRGKIAEVCGYEKRDDGYWHEKGRVGSCGIPDYFADLNAMNKAEKMLTDEQFSDYGWRMLRSEPNIECRQYLSASAAQRAEAFGRTLGLWMP